MIRFLAVVSIAMLACVGARAETEVLYRTYVEPTDVEKVGQIEFDPSVMNGLYHWQTIFEDLFETPVFLNAEGEFEPGGARDWSYSEDGMTLTLNLQQDRVWSDGEPVTAEDYVFALSRMRDPEFAHSSAKFITTSIAGFAPDSGEPFGVKALSPHQLQIRLTEPYAVDESSLSEIAFAPLPLHKAPADDPVMWSSWPGGVTNGAYTLEKVTDTSILLRRNPRAPANLTAHYERVETTMRDWPQAAEAFLAGEIDYLYNIPERQIPWFEEQKFRTLVTSGRIYYYALNRKRPQLADRRVRRALRLAIDREALIKQLFPGSAKPAYSLVPVGVQDYEVDPSLVPADIEAAFEEARSLMTEAGYGPENRLKLSLSSNYNVQHENIGEFVRFNWSQIYVDLELDIKEEDFSVWFKGFSEGDYEVGRRSWNAGKSRIDAFMDVCKALNDARCGYYDDPEYEKVLAQAYAEEDIDRSRRLFQQADRMIVEADVLAPVFHGIVLVALGERIDASELGNRIRRVRSFELKPKR